MYKSVKIDCSVSVKERSRQGQENNKKNQNWIRPDCKVEMKIAILI